MFLADYSPKIEAKNNTELGEDREVIKKKTQQQQ